MKWIIGLVVASVVLMGATCAPMQAQPAPQNVEDDGMGFQWTGVGVQDESPGTLTAAASLVTTVPDGVYWEITGLFGIVDTTATAGNRLLQVVINDDSSNVMRTVTWYTTAPASVIAYLETNQAAPTDSETTASTFMVITTPYSPIFLPPGYTLQLQDLAAIDASDTFELVIQYKEYRYVSDTQQVAIVGDVNMKGNIGLVQGG